MVFHTGFIAVKGAVAHFAVIVDVYIGLTVVARDDNARFLLLGQVQTCNHLENFNQDVYLKRQDFKELVQSILELFIEKEISSVQLQALSRNNPVKNSLVELLHTWRTSHIRSVSKVNVLVILEDYPLFLELETMVGVSRGLKNDPVGPQINLFTLVHFYFSTKPWCYI